MDQPRTGAERYLARRLDDPVYRDGFDQARARVDQVDRLIRFLDARRTDLDLTKADLARRAGIKPEAVRRLFSAEAPNPTLATLLALSDALDLELQPVPRRSATGATAARSAAPGTRRRSA